MGPKYVRPKVNSVDSVGKIKGHRALKLSAKPSPGAHGQPVDHLNPPLCHYSYYDFFFNKENHPLLELVLPS